MIKCLYVVLQILAFFHLEVGFDGFPNVRGSIYISSSTPSLFAYCLGFECFFQLLVRHYMIVSSPQLPLSSTALASVFGVRAREKRRKKVGPVVASSVAMFYVS